MRLSSQADRRLTVGVSAGPIQSEKAYSILRREIVSCKLRPGSKLRINEIALRLDVSVSAVREALSRMAVEELVVATAQKGFSVSPISSAEILDVTKTRIAIESLCLVGAIRNGSIEWESQITAAFHTLTRTPFTDPHDEEIVNEEWVTAHSDFHHSLASGCGSPSLLKIQRSLYVQSERYRQLSGRIHHHGRDIVVEHRALMEAALERNEQLMLERIKVHLEKTTDIILESLE
jgi:GntR family transcriptional regulator, carbon starvation induced regulator